MVTQLQDVSNTVAKEKISSDRLRNEEIRRNMGKAWSAPTDTSSGSSPTSLQSLSISPSGTAPTMASTYSSMKNNFQSMGLGDYATSTSLPSNWKTQGWAPSAAGLGASIFGAGPYSGLASAAVNYSQGNKTAAAANLTSSVTNALNKSGIPGVGGLAGSLVGGILGDKSAADIGKDMFNSGLGTVIGAANPIAGLGYGLARLFGFDSARAMSDYAKSDIAQRFDAGYQGGVWGGSGRGSWTPTAPDSPTNTYSGSGYGNTAGPGSGSGYTPSTYGYSNPASSYGGWSTTDSSTGGDGGGD